MLLLYFGPLLDSLPVNDFPELLNELGSVIGVVEVVCMLPHIESQQWHKVLVGIHQSVLVAGHFNLQAV